MKLEFHPEAEQEFLEAALHYETDVELRKLVLERFPYFLIYSVSAETVHIVAVAHEKRRPGYWQERVKS